MPTIKKQNQNMYRVRRMQLFHDPKCTKCNNPVVIGQRYWVVKNKYVTHAECVDPDLKKSQSVL